MLLRLGSTLKLGLMNAVSSQLTLLLSSQPPLPALLDLYKGKKQTTQKKVL